MLDLVVYITIIQLYVYVLLFLLTDHIPWLTIAQLAEHLTVVVQHQKSECPWFDSEW